MSVENITPEDWAKLVDTRESLQRTINMLDQLLDERPNFPSRKTFDLATIEAIREISKRNGKG